MDANTANNMNSQSSGSQSSDAQSCPNCGMDKASWRGNNGQGFQVGDKTYCCQGCGTGTGCTCG